MRQRCRTGRSSGKAGRGHAERSKWKVAASYDLWVASSKPGGDNMMESKAMAPDGRRSGRIDGKPEALRNGGARKKKGLLPKTANLGRQGGSNPAAEEARWRPDEPAEKSRTRICRKEGGGQPPGCGAGRGKIARGRPHDHGSKPAAPDGPRPVRSRGCYRTGAEEKNA